MWIITGQVAWQSYPGRRPVCFIESIRREILAGQSEPVIGDSHQQHGRQVREREGRQGRRWLSSQRADGSTPSGLSPPGGMFSTLMRAEDN